MITQEYLKSILEYNPETGAFAWKISGKGIRYGVEVGTVDIHGYRIIRINRKGYKAHRLAWLYVYGRFPERIDHINCIKDDNRIENLREATNGENRVNSLASKNNKLGVKGIKKTPSGKFQVNIRIPNGSVKCLGSFDTIEKAKETYNNAAKWFHGEFVHWSIK